jgi:flagellum-specific peptidoglycan hydrolase FlgJ
MGFLVWHGKISMAPIPDEPAYDLRADSVFLASLPDSTAAAYMEQDTATVKVKKDAGSTLPVAYSKISFKRSVKSKSTVSADTKAVAFTSLKEFSAAADVPDDAVQSFVRRFLPIALVEQQKYGIPASVTLAQAWLESGGGESRLVQKSNNFFGEKCFDRKRPSVGHSDDFASDRFVKFPSPWQSFRSHSKFIAKNKSRYGGLFQAQFKRKTFEKFNTKRYVLKKNKKYHYDGKFQQKLAVMARDWHIPYKRWAFGLDVTGYATDNRYAYALTNFIETHKLHRWDNVKVVNAPKSM